MDANASTETNVVFKIDKTIAQSIKPQSRFDKLALMRDGVYLSKLS